MATIQNLIEDRILHWNRCATKIMGKDTYSVNPKYAVQINNEFIDLVVMTDTDNCRLCHRAHTMINLCINDELKDIKLFELTKYPK